MLKNRLNKRLSSESYEWCIKNITKKQKNNCVPKKRNSIIKFIIVQIYTKYVLKK